MHLKVGELGRRTGLTVRTLHHYDEIGLLKPARTLGQAAGDRRQNPPLAAPVLDAFPAYTDLAADQPRRAIHIAHCCR